MGTILHNKYKSALLVLHLVSSLALPVYAETSETVQAAQSQTVQHWAYAALDKWEDRGWITGSGDGDLRPDDSITRAEFASLMNRAFGLGEVNKRVQFLDLQQSHWAYLTISSAINHGYMSGYADQTVRPSKPVTREEAAVMIARILGLDGTSSNHSVFTDQDQLASWSASSVARTVKAGIFSGFPDGSFKPQGLLTRAEAVVSLDRALQASQLGTIYAKAGEYGPTSGVEVVKGNVMVSAAGVKLRNLHIEGDLLIAASVGEGDVYLSSITVDGTMTIQGGGENSIHLSDSILLSVIVDKQTGTVRIVASGQTVIKEVELQSPSIVNTTGLIDGGGISVVNLSEKLPKDARIQLLGGFETVNVLAKSIKIAIPVGVIESLYVDKDAAASEIDISKEVSIIEMILNAAVAIVGDGDVKKATVNAAGVLMEKAPESIEMGNDISGDTKVEIGGQEKTVDAVKTTAPGLGIGGGTGAGGEIGGGSPPPAGGGQTTPDDEDRLDNLDQEFRFVPLLDVTASNLVDRKLSNAALLFLDKHVDSVQSHNGQWALIIDGKAYKLGIKDESASVDIPILNVGIAGYAPDYVNIELDYDFINHFTLYIKLYESSATEPIAFHRGVTPIYPLIIKVKDQDVSEGLDGRDFTVEWAPSGRSGVTKRMLYILPAPYGSLDTTKHTPVASFTDLSVYSWTGDERITVDSQGQAFKQGTSYMVYIAEETSDMSWVAISSRSYLPKFDGVDPGNYYVPKVMVSSLNNLPLHVQAYTSNMSETTVGSMVYGISDTDGYLYLLPGYITEAGMDSMNAAVTDGLGLRHQVIANMPVAFDTSSLNSGSYRLIGVSLTNESVTDMDYGAIKIYANDLEEIGLWGSIWYPSLDIYAVVFNKKIENALDSMDSLREAVFIRDSNGNLYALDSDHEIFIRENELHLNISNWALEDTISVVIDAGTLRVVNGDKINREIESYAFDYPAKLTLNALETHIYTIGEEIKVTANKDAVVYLASIEVSGYDSASLDIEVESGRGVKMNMQADQEYTFTTAGLEAGSYKFVDLRGMFYFIELRDPT